MSKSKDIASSIELMRLSYKAIQNGKKGNWIVGGVLSTVSLSQLIVAREIVRTNVSPDELNVPLVDEWILASIYLGRQMPIPPDGSRIKVCTINGRTLWLDQVPLGAEVAS